MLQLSIVLQYKGSGYSASVGVSYALSESFLSISFQLQSWWPNKEGGHHGVFQQNETKWRQKAFRLEEIWRIRTRLEIENSLM